MGKGLIFWMGAFVVLAIATIINIFIPDPVPLIDELVMTIASIFVGIKTIKSLISG